jgi:hypothetical protein
MNKAEVISKLCELVSKVGRQKFDSIYAHDCFCGENPFHIGIFHVDKPIMDFIEEAIEEKLKA